MILFSLDVIFFLETGRAVLISLLESESGLFWGERVSEETGFEFSMRLSELGW